MDINGARANIPGSIWKILVQEGEKVSEGDTLMVIESMKMDFPIVASSSGVIENLYLGVGEQVSSGQLLASIRL